MGKFEKETHRDEYFAAEKKELKMLIDPKTGGLYEEFKEYVNCPLCGKDNYEELFAKQGFRFVKCRPCGLVYTNPQVKEEKILDSYASIKSADIWVDVLLSKPEMEYDTKKFNAQLNDLERIMPGKGRILEIGCSFGLFLKLAKGRGWDTVGLELNKKAFDYATRQFGLDVRAKTIEEAGFKPQEFDVIALFGVLEHLKGPRKILELSNKLLKQDSLLAVLVPNVEGLDVEILKEQSTIFTGRNHLQFFSIKTLSAMLKLTGFKLLDYKTTVSSLDPILNYMHGRDPFQTQEDVVIIDEARQRLERFILKNNLGRHLHVLAKRA